MGERNSPRTGGTLVSELIRLETAKKDALIRFDAAAFEDHTREQTRLVDATPTPQNPDLRLDDLLKLNRLIRLNTALVLNLHSISPWVAVAREGYTAAGEVSTAPTARQLSIEA